MSEPSPPARRATSPRSLALRIVVGALITAAFLYTLTRYVDWPRVRALFSSTRWGWIVIGGLIYTPIYLLRAVRFWLLAPRLRYHHVLAIVCVHNLLLRLLPMRTGDLSYAILLKRAGGEAGLTRGVMSLLLVRILDVGGVVLIFAITLALNHSMYRGDAAVGFVGAGVIALLGALGAIYFRSVLRLGARLLGGIARLLRLDRAGRVGAALERVRSEIASYERVPLPKLLRLIAATLCAWLLNFVFVFAIMRAFSVKVSAAQAVLGGTAAVVSGFLPVSGIGSFGALEAGWALGFVLVGLETPVAVASAFGFSIVTLAYAALFGVVGWLALGALSRRADNETSLDG